MTDGETPQTARLVDASNRMGFRLLSQLAEEEDGKNLFLSSLSIAIALAMVYNGAEGEAQAALARLLGFEGLSLQEVNLAYSELVALLGGLDPGVRLDVANSIWVREGTKLAADFIQRIREVYAGEVAHLDFADPGAADVINDWVAEKTSGKIKQLVTPPMIELAVVVLINAIYFKGIWAAPFDEAKTTDGPFTLPDGSRKQLPMMRQTGRYGYYENETFQAIRLPYGGGRVSMYIFLPRPDLSLAALQELLTAENWQEWMGGVSETRVELVLPRFRVEYRADLLSALVKLAGPKMTGPDFLGMGGGPLIISRVIHKTFVEVNEEGTEAAAATAVVMTRSMMQPPQMVVDRPFLCAIRDDETGLVLFMGFVVDPEPVGNP